MTPAICLVPDELAPAHGPFMPWEEEPYRLWSLHEMLQFSAFSFFWCGMVLKNIQGDCMVGAMVSVDDEPGFNLGQDLDQMARDKALKLLPQIAKTFRRVGLVITAETVDDLIGDLNGQHRHSFDWLHTQTKNIEDLATKELRNRTFLYIPPERAKFFPRANDIDIFGARVAERFPDAGRDVHSAGLCLATANTTAAVFHLMRVLEHGLRAIAARFNVPCEIDSWHKVIRGIEEGIKDLREKTGLTNEDRASITAYSDAASEFRYFKDAWRNHVSHAKSVYNDQEAERIFEHVKSFMQKLAEIADPSTD